MDRYDASLISQPEYRCNSVKQLRRDPIIMSLIESFGVGTVYSMQNPTLAKFLAGSVVFILTITYGIGAGRAQLDDDAQAPAPSESMMMPVGAIEEIILSPWGLSFLSTNSTRADLSPVDARAPVVRNDSPEV